MAVELKKNASGLVYPLQDKWKICNKNLPADQNIFGTNLTYRSSLHHWGWDLSAPVGTNVYAIAAGEIVSTLWVNGYGQLFMHGFQFNNKTCYVLYAHLSSISIKSGSVTKGQIIGQTGTSGTAASSSDPHYDPHLHLEFHSNINLTMGLPGKINPNVFFGAPPL